MSGFFGFDPMSGSNKKDEQELSFDDTYRGYNKNPQIINEDEYDILNSETFGDMATKDLDTAFDFGYGTSEQDSSNLKSVNQLEENSLTPDLNQPHQQQPQIQQIQPLGFDLNNGWPTIPQQQPPQQQQQQLPNFFNQQTQQQFPNNFGMQFPNNMMPPPQFMNQQNPQQMNGQPFLPQMNTQQQGGMFPGMPMPPNGLPPLPPQLQQQMMQQFQQMMQQQGGMPPINGANIIPPQGLQNPVPPQMPVGVGSPESLQEQGSKNVSVNERVQQPLQHPQMVGNESFPSPQADLIEPEKLQEQGNKPFASGLPTLDDLSKNNLTKKQKNQQQTQQQQLQTQQPLPLDSKAQFDGQQNNINRNYYQNNNRNYYPNNNNPNNRKLNISHLTPEEQRIRQRKVERILSHHGLMTHRDKDFLTRLQLSRIVNQDPLETDFYYQFFKIMKSTSAAGANHSIDAGMNEKDAIAKAYLDISGHRLGGKKRNVSLALQKMQSQVIAAVTVAKERSGTVVANPRKRIEVLNKEKKEDEDSEINAESNQLGNVENEQNSFDDKSIDSLKKAKIISENVYDCVLELENGLRSNSELDKTQLARLLLQSSDNDLRLFFSLNKSLKLLPRIFNFLEFEEKYEFVNRVFKQLTQLEIIQNSSAMIVDSNENNTFSKQECVDFQKIFLKLTCSMLSQCTLQQIIQLTQSICSNNLVLLCTTKIGLNLITVLINRTVLFKNELQMSSWDSVYEFLFTQLQSHFSQFFPPLNNGKEDTYIWQFFASLAMAGKLNHQRVIIDEIRDHIFYAIDVAEKGENTTEELKIKIYQNLNLFFNVMGLVCRNGEITEL
ncbi:hypothetical protein ACO0SA_000567 [Hanseniaspora valbyensis]